MNWSVDTVTKRNIFLAPHSAGKVTLPAFGAPQPRAGNTKKPVNLAAKSRFRCIPRLASASALAIALIGLLQGCQGNSKDHIASNKTYMFDCQFENNRHLHLHISEARGTASVISSYQPGAHANHTSDIRQGRESEAILVPPGPNSQYTLELFLLNDRFGQVATEKVLIHLGLDGRTRMEAQLLEGQTRVLDFGTCSSAHSIHRPSH